MASLNDRVFDNGLSVLSTEATHLYLTSTEATTYTEATSTYAIGNSADLSVASPSDRSAGGREVICSITAAGNITSTGTAAYYAIVDSTNSRLLATGDLAVAQSVVNGNTFDLGSFAVGIPDPA